MKHKIWIEGYNITGQSQQATQLVKDDGSTQWEANSFKEACKKAITELGWDMKHYDEDQNIYWGCRFFDSEKSAREAFG